MRDEQFESWARDSSVPVAMLESLRGLNHGFLELLGAPTDDWNSTVRAGLPVELWGRVAPLSCNQKKAAADCPYALFDLRFHDDDHWRMRLRAPGPWQVHEDAASDEKTFEFTRLALFFAWHVASTAKFAARFLLGMSEPTAAAFRSLPIDCVPRLAATEAINLTARWCDRPTYWNALASAALRPNPANLRRIQLSGLQLTAAVELA